MFSRIQMWMSSFMANPVQAVITFVLFSAALLISLILHECAHGFVALKCGDPTAKWMGRLTLDPRKHLDPIGIICMVFLGIGWAKPVPVNPNNFRKRSRDMIFVSIAGITVNLILFLISMFLWVLSLKNGSQFMEYIRVFLQYMYSFNLSLAIFNLLPVPPLDGFRLLNQVMFKGQLNLDERIMTYVRYGFLFLCLSGVLSNAFSRVCGFIANETFRLFVQLIY